MAPITASTARKEEEQTLAARLPGLIGAVSDRKDERKDDGKLVGGEWLSALVEQAIDRVMSRKEAAILCGLSESEFSKQLKGIEGRSLNVRRLGALGERFLVAFTDELRAFYKIDDPAAQQARGVELVTKGLALLIQGVKTK